MTPRTLDLHRGSGDALIRRSLRGARHNRSVSIDGLDRIAILNLAGPRYFERGEDYYLDGRVEALQADGGTLKATVRGTRPYTVTLRATADDLEWSCDCPLAAEGAFCKHCVAAGLAALSPAAAKVAPIGPPVALDELRERLEALDREALVSLLIAEARVDEGVRERFVMRAASAGVEELDLASLRGAIERAVAPRGFVPYAEAQGWAEGVERVIDPLGDLLAGGRAAEVVDLAEHCLAALERAAGEVDDSDGHVGVLLDRVQRIHREACERARPDPVALAERLYRWALDSELDLFYDAVDVYWELLGAAGQRRYAELARAEWERLPQLEPGDERGWGRFVVEHVMEKVTQRMGGLEGVVEVKRRNLSSPYSFLQIAELYRDGGREADAIGWAERGLSAFPDRVDHRLTDFLADVHAEAGRHECATELAWSKFAEWPGLEAYEDLKRRAEPAGEWPQRREWALALLRRRIEGRGDDSARFAFGTPPGDRSELVRIFLFEGDAEAAWREAAGGGCTAALWLELAERRAGDHPDDALAVWRAHVDHAIARKDKRGYREAVRLIERIGHTLAALGRDGELAPYVEQLRTEHRRKRSLQALLDGTAPARAA